MPEAPVVAIVGRPNVGKSTLFNRIVGRPVAVVGDVAGITRDRVSAPGTWSGVDMEFIDTGGIGLDEDPGGISVAVRRQAERAIARADALLFVVDGKTGMTPLDGEVSEILHAAAKPVIVVVNKAESAAGLDYPVCADFYRTGFDTMVPVSAAHGTGVGDLLDQLVAMLPEGRRSAGAAAEAPGAAVRVALLGKPNVGKSSIVNRVVGEERVITSETPGTTRDSVDVSVTWQGSEFVFVDTPGLRKKSRVEESGLERWSVAKALGAIPRADVAVIVVDATSGITVQDSKIAGAAHDAGRACVIAVNKWDLLPPERRGQEALAFKRDLLAKLIFVHYAPVVFTSAVTGQGIHGLLTAIQNAARQHSRRVPTGELNRVIQRAVESYPSSSRRGKPLRLRYITQVGTGPPTFVLFVNDAGLVHFSYERFLENRLRDAFGFEATPLRLIARSGRDTR